MNTTLNPASLAFLQGGGASGGLLGLLPFILIFVIFYFLLIRPQQKKQRLAQAERDTMLKALKAGDKVRIKDGPWKALEGVVERDVKPSDRVMLLLTAINFQGRLTIESDWLEKIA